MPLYEFECQKCHTRFEKLVRSHKAISEVTCINCNSKTVQKLLSAPSHHAPASLPSAGQTSGCPSHSPFR